MYIHLEKKRGDEHKLRIICASEFEIVKRDKMISLMIDGRRYDMGDHNDQYDTITIKDGAEIIYQKSRIGLEESRF